MMMCSNVSSSITYFDADATDVGLLAAQVRQQDVLRFQVAVDDAFAVEDAHGSSNLLQENPQCVLSQCALSFKKKIGCTDAFVAP